MSIRDLLPWTRDEGNPSPDVVKKEDPFLALQSEVNRLFDDAFRHFRGGFPGGRSPFADRWPVLDVVDADKEIRITAEMPGMDEKDIEILLADGTLTLKGEKREEKEDKDRKYTERRYGRFERRIPLGYAVEEDKVEASFADGVLTITLPKSEKELEKVRRIAIRK